MRVETLTDGIAINTEFPPDGKGGVDAQQLFDVVLKAAGLLPLVIADPPYGNIVDREYDKITSGDNVFATTLINWTIAIGAMSTPGAALYFWGGIGKPRFRPYFKYLSRVEEETSYELSSLITWKKKRAYGIQWGYLFTREECAYLIKGDAKKPLKFNPPYLDVERGYEGYNKKYPAKSKFFRRTNVWDDITEIFKGKVHINQKPEALAKVMIEAHTEPGEWVMDPFAGSGSTALAARALGRKFIMIEKDPVEFEKMLKRLKE